MLHTLEEFGMLTSIHIGFSIHIEHAFPLLWLDFFIVVWIRAGILLSNIQFGADSVSRCDIFIFITNNYSINRFFYILCG